MFSIANRGKKSKSIRADIIYKRVCVLIFTQFLILLILVTTSLKNLNPRSPTIRYEGANACLLPWWAAAGRNIGRKLSYGSDSCIHYRRWSRKSEDVLARERRRERRTGGENQARDTSNSFINGLSRRECLRTRFSVLLGNRKIHQPDASSPPNSSGLSVSAREYALSLSPLTIAISRARSSRLSR